MNQEFPSSSLVEHAARLFENAKDTYDVPVSMRGNEPDPDSVDRVHVPYGAGEAALSALIEAGEPGFKAALLGLYQIEQKRVLARAVMSLVPDSEKIMEKRRRTAAIFNEPIH